MGAMRYSSEENVDKMYPIKQYLIRFHLQLLILSCPAFRELSGVANYTTPWHRNGLCLDAMIHQCYKLQHVLIGPRASGSLL